MRTFGVFRMLACLLWVTGGCSEPAPGWHVAGDFLRAPDGSAVIMRGVNLSGAHKNTPYLDDKQPADYQRIRTAWGMNAVRFVMTWAAVEPVPGQYDDAYLDRVAERMDWAQAAGLMVVLDMHEDVYGEGFGFDGAPRWACDESRYAAFQRKEPWFVNALEPNVMACVDDFYVQADVAQHFADAWRHVATRLAGHPAVIGFDVLNEPHWGSYPLFDFEQDRLAPMYRRVVAAVRAAAPGWVAFLEPGASRNVGIATGLTDLELTNVMYAPHSYDSGAEGGGGFDVSHRQQILDNVAALAGEARALGAGLWIGEYGGVATAPGIVEYMTAQYDAAGQVAGSAMYWSYDKSSGYGLLDADGNEKPALIDVLVRPYPERVAGDPISYAFDADTATFTLTYRPDSSLKVPTEIVVPARRYPNGYQVECGGCRYHPQGDELVIDTPAAGNPAVVTLTAVANTRR